MRVWDLARAEVHHMPLGHSSSVTSVGVSSDGNLAVSSDGIWIKVWDVKNARLRYHREFKNQAIVAVGITQNPERVFFLSNSIIWIWNFNSDKAVVSRAIDMPLKARSRRIKSDRERKLITKEVDIMNEPTIATVSVKQSIHFVTTQYPRVEYGAATYCFYLVPGNHFVVLQSWDPMTDEKPITRRVQTPFATLASMSGTGQTVAINTINTDVLNLQREEVVLNTYADARSQHVSDVSDDEHYRIDCINRVTGFYIPSDEGMAIFVEDEAVIKIVDLNENKFDINTLNI
jgi:WD40 repeat protein